MLMSENEFNRICDFFLFKNVSPVVVEQALGDELCELVDYCKGDIIYSVHRYQRSVGVILFGRIQVSKEAGDAHQYIMNTLGTGDCFGVAAVFSDAQEYVTVLKAMSPCRVVFFPQKLLERLIEECPAIAKNYIGFLSDRIRFLNDKIQGLISTSAVQTLVNYLINSYTEEEDGAFVQLDGSVSSLANKLNIGRSSLYRAFDQLELGGVISRGGKSIRILDPEKLGKYL